jgi:hypothetical protein
VHFCGVAIQYRTNSARPVAYRSGTVKRTYDSRFWGVTPRCVLNHNVENDIKNSHKHNYIVPDDGHHRGPKHVVVSRLPSLAMKIKCSCVYDCLFHITFYIVTTVDWAALQETQFWGPQTIYQQLWSHAYHENCALLGCYALNSGNILPTFRDDRAVSSSGVMNIKPFRFMAPEDGTDRLSRNMGNKLPLLAA